ncbi:serine/arginine-rich splicing factor 5-like isoform X1 [Bufo bufo]|uniref:serine/arginine-rich splicing factor 5-like isoform X1 n=1 Tax=Bufo bufo TaxID=8384 RepID=UPI001ABDC122|nr:serine/arginine-rich splicing factor 5-like isoform X1 [Bufo bufo]
MSRSSAMPRIYIGRLSHRARQSDVERFFKGFGKILEVDLKNGYGFVEFEDVRDADDAVYEMNGRDLCGERVIVEHTRAPRRGLHNGYGYRKSATEKPGPPVRTMYRLKVENLSARCSCQELKDFMGQVGEVTFVDANHLRPNEGITEFRSYSDNEESARNDWMVKKSMVEKIRLVGIELDLGPDALPHRSRSRSNFNSRSQRSSHSKSRSRSRSRRRTRRSKSPSKDRRHSKSVSKGRRDSRSRTKERSMSKSNRSVRKRGQSHSYSEDRVKRSKNRSRSRSKLQKSRDSRSPTTEQKKNASRSKERESRSQSEERDCKSNERSPSKEREDPVNERENNDSQEIERSPEKELGERERSFSHDRDRSHNKEKRIAIKKRKK